MTRCKKSDIENIVSSLPEETSIEEVMEKLYLFSKVEKGLHQADQGLGFSHLEVKEKLQKWLE
ncbi:MAG: hypothetical protein PF518_04190 [Spirochaetaceae bacterium]|jgi:predicted transcriptional regulator|nr:hypothetical protein [Spirochaetaceae bacterium]